MRHLCLSRYQEVLGGCQQFEDFRLRGYQQVLNVSSRGSTPDRGQASRLPTWLHSAQLATKTRLPPVNATRANVGRGNGGTCRIAGRRLTARRRDRGADWLARDAYLAKAGTYRIAARGRFAHCQPRRRRLRGRVKPPDSHWFLRSGHIHLGHSRFPANLGRLTPLPAPKKPGRSWRLGCWVTQVGIGKPVARTGGAHLRTVAGLAPGHRTRLQTALAPASAWKAQVALVVQQTNPANTEPAA